MYAGTHRFEFDVHLTAQNQKEYLQAVDLIHERMMRVIQGKEIRKPIHPLTHQHGTQLATIVSVNGKLHN